METVEGEVFKAFAKAGAISDDNSTNPQKVRPRPASLRIWIRR